MGTNKQLLIFFFAALFSVRLLAAGDTLSIYEIFYLAEENFPILKKDSLLQQQLQLRLKNLGSAYLPQVSAKGSATYQSDVVQFPFDLPMVEPLDLPHERYQAYVELTQTIYDGGYTGINKELTNLESEISRKQVQMSLAKLKEHIIQLYLGVLVNRQGNRILKSSHQLLTDKLSILDSAYAGGLIDKTSLLRMKAELIRLEQRLTETEKQQAALLDALSIITGNEITRETVFSIPKELIISGKDELNRSDLQLIGLQQEKLRSAMKLHSAAGRPKLSAFGQGGVGYPNPYNLFDATTSPYYLIGARFTWDFFNWGDNRREREMLMLQSQMLSAEKESLQQNIDVNLQQQMQKISELESVIIKDRELLQLRQEIHDLASSQLDNGVISTNDYIDAVNEQQAAELQLEMHQTRLAMAKANYLNERGTFFSSKHTAP